MANVNNNVDAVRHRSARAVEYYKKTVLPIYQGSQGTSPFNDYPHYGSSDNINGMHMNVPTHRGDGHSRGEKERRVGFSNNEPTDISPPKDSYLIRGGHRATIHGTSSAGGSHSGSKPWNKSSKKDKKSPPKEVRRERTPPKSKRISGGLYRSNSNLELDNENGDLESAHDRSLHRDYGSTSSIDVLGTGNSDGFFAMLKDFKDLNLDQRSPAPAKLHELLKGGLDKSGGRADQQRTFNHIANGSILMDSARSGASADDIDSPRSKSKFKHKDRKGRAKSITNEIRPGLFTKFRGKPDTDAGAKTPENIDIDLRSEERLRSKAFCHYDCQSIGFDLNDVLSKQNQSLKSKKTSGASAASAADRNSYAADKNEQDVLGDEDEGDGKNNGLVLSCPFFRNELGGEEERTICLNKATAHKSSQVTTTTHSAISSPPSRSAACCGMSILDSAPTPSTKIILPHVVLHRGRVIEYVDRGATYYRHFFYGYGKCSGIIRL